MPCAHPCHLHYWQDIPASIPCSIVFPLMLVSAAAANRDKVHLLSDYAQQQPLPDSEVLRQGGLALLPRSMSRQLQVNLEQLRHVVDVPRPCLADASPEAIERWNWMVLTVMLGAAGLVRYLIDAYSDDLPEYDPL